MGSGRAVQRAYDKDRTEQNLKDFDSGHSEALAFPAIGAPWRPRPITILSIFIFCAYASACMNGYSPHVCQMPAEARGCRPQSPEQFLVLTI